MLQCVMVFLQHHPLFPLCARIASQLRAGMGRSHELNFSSLLFHDFETRLKAVFDRPATAETLQRGCLVYGRVANYVVNLKLKDKD